MSLSRVRPETPVFLETAGRDLSVWEILAGEQQNFSKFDPEDSRQMRASIEDQGRFGVKLAHLRRFTQILELEFRIYLLQLQCITSFLADTISDDDSSRIAERKNFAELREPPLSALQKEENRLRPMFKGLRSIRTPNLTISE